MGYGQRAGDILSRTKFEVAGGIVSLALLRYDL